MRCVFILWFGAFAGRNASDAVDPIVAQSSGGACTRHVALCRDQAKVSQDMVVGEGNGCSVFGFIDDDQ